MVDLNFRGKALFAVLCLAVFGGHSCSAQLFPKEPKKWWPDPSTGLMWAEHSYSATRSSHGFNWQKSVDYCAALQLGGFSGWRIPTLDEVKAIAYTKHGVVTSSSEPDMTCHTDNPVMRPCPNNITTTGPYDQVTLKIPEWNDYFFPELWI